MAGYTEWINKFDGKNRKSVHIFWRFGLLRGYNMELNPAIAHHPAGIIRKLNMIYDAITNTTACILWITKCDEGILLEYQERSGNAIETNILFTDPDGESSNTLRKSIIVKKNTEILSCLLQQGIYSDCPRPDLIILDLDLPEAFGFNVLSSIKSDMELKITPVIVFTSSKDEADIRKAYKYHANCYVIKSVDFDMFYRKIRAIENFWLNFAELPVKKTTA